MGVLWSSPSPPRLFTPIQVGKAKLEHRVVLAPLTRRRADDLHVHTDLAVEYYTQRSSTPGTLLITEGTFIAVQAGGYTTVPGVWNDAQVAAWKKIVDAVHANGSSIFLQLWALGRSADAELLQKEGPFDVVSASAIPIPDRPDRPVPRPLTVDEIKEYAQLYAKAAQNAVEGAGFDGVEIHSANGYLLDQFIQTNSNKRTDEYGGSIENRIRFPLEVVQAITDAVGQERTAIRFSPWSPFQGMREEDPIPVFTALIEQLVERHPNLAYVHVVEPRVSGNNDTDKGGENDSNDFIRKLWAPRPLIRAGGYKRHTALEAAEQEADSQNVLIAFGRYFISNPDLPKRLKADVELTQYDRSTFYTKGPKGYTDYPFYDDETVLLALPKRTDLAEALFMVESNSSWNTSIY